MLCLIQLTLFSETKVIPWFWLQFQTASNAGSFRFKTKDSLRKFELGVNIPRVFLFVVVVVCFVFVCFAYLTLSSHLPGSLSGIVTFLSYSTRHQPENPICCSDVSPRQILCQLSLFTQPNVFHFPGSGHCVPYSRFQTRTFDRPGFVSHVSIE